MEKGLPLCAQRKCKGGGKVICKKATDPMEEKKTIVGLKKSEGEPA